MSKIKKLASITLAATMVSSAVCFALPAGAATTDSTQKEVSSEANLQSNVQDGVILQAFNWSYNSIKQNLAFLAASGYTTIQTSPVQQPKDFCASNDVSGQWWKLYQPVSMSVAKNSWLGTKDELKSLCDEAKKYGIKIICDVVTNHMGNETEDNPNSISSQIETYDPEIFKNSSTYFRNNKIMASDSSVANVVTGHVSSCPDLNSGNAGVQNEVIDLLKECIDCGVDGFRFDAAKHIETPSDGSYASDFWPNVTSAAENYYTKKTGKDLYIYGEILNSCGASRKYSAYTDYINVTDNRTGDAVLYNVVNKNANNASNSSYKSGVDASNAVIWAESHDTYEGTSGSQGITNTASVSDEDIVKAWAIVASRKDSTALYFARPGSALMGEAGTDTTYKSTTVSEVNKFHNAFVGKSEKLGASDGVAYVARANNGIVLSNCAGKNKDVTISGTGLSDGTYTDTITGSKFTVSSGVLSGSIGSTGVAVVYDADVTPKNTCSVESSTFNGETLIVNLGLENAKSGTYQLENCAPVTYTSNTAIRIGSDYAYGDTIKLTLTATDGKNKTTQTYEYVKKETATSGVYVFFNAESRSSWTKPLNIYIYDEDSSTEFTYSVAGWPGAQMKLDSKSGYYYFEVPANSCLAKASDGTITQSDFDLAHSENAYVIISSASGQQYPGATSKTKLKLGGHSMILGKSKVTAWEQTDLVPAQEEQQEATDVTKGEEQEKILYGDADQNGLVDINDVSLIQKCLASKATLSENGAKAADVLQDGLDINDCTAIQKYLAGKIGGGMTGKYE